MPLDKSSLVISRRKFLKNWVISIVSCLNQLWPFQKLFPPNMVTFMLFFHKNPFVWVAMDFFGAKWQVLIFNKCWLGRLKTFRTSDHFWDFEMVLFFYEGRSSGPRVRRVPNIKATFQTWNSCSFPSPTIRVNWALLLARRLIPCILLPCFVPKVTRVNKALFTTRLIPCILLPCFVPEVLEAFLTNCEEILCEVPHKLGCGNSMFSNWEELYNWLRFFCSKTRNQVYGNKRSSWQQTIQTLQVLS